MAHQECLDECDPPLGLPLVVGLQDLLVVTGTQPHQHLVVDAVFMETLPASPHNADPYDGLQLVYVFPLETT
eukprot:CAMPEP_0201281902 /NCGR_PEP_ID=MMETSP1317-20130820/4342_1 /ASSEMBLY_ACC=CAM_ASM_000770 /TAXON_ID=187299 /ORGANISM="Undescribed Undescribed, Strain Undescribed" /LENGTH=71 /DNA_ID=CAMNT_0047593093 /DNA_START=86 /DNA_END=301 /DNA_ORIENTATION=-